MHPRLDVLTLVRNRSGHLARLLAGLETGEVRPDSVVVAVMGGDDPGDVLSASTLSVRSWTTAAHHSPTTSVLTPTT